MGDFSGYTLQDFLLFSEQAYVRMLMLHNAEAWPVQVMIVAFGAIVLAAIARGHRQALMGASMLLGLAWLWLAWSYFGGRYQSINWAAAYVVPVAAAEGLVLIAMAWRGVAMDGGHRARSAGCALGFAIAVIGVIGYPLLAPVTGRPWQAAEVVGLFPDPTAVATLGVLAMSQTPLAWAAMVLPVLWCLATGLTLFALGTLDFAVAPVLALGAVIARGICSGGRGAR